MNKIGGIFKSTNIDTGNNMIPLNLNVIKILTIEINSHIDKIWYYYTEEHGKHLRHHDNEKPYYESYNFDVSEIMNPIINAEDFRIHDDQYGVIIIDGSYLDMLDSEGLFKILSRYRKKLAFNKIILICEHFPSKGCKKCNTNDCISHVFYIHKHHVSFIESADDFDIDFIYNKLAKKNIVVDTSTLSIIALIVKNSRNQK